MALSSWLIVRDDSLPPGATDAGSAFVSFKLLLMVLSTPYELRGDAICPFRVACRLVRAGSQSGLT
jgi:hypothetical protein